MSSQFSFNGITKKLNVETVNIQMLSKCFNVKEDSIYLIDEKGDVYEQRGFTPKLENGKVFKIIGDPMKQILKKPTFTQGEMTNLKNQVLSQTKKMCEQLDGVSHAVRAVSMVNSLNILIACTKDCSLVNDNTQGTEFKFLNSPRSFKASLVQVTNSAIRAFTNADAATTKIKVNLAGMPDTMMSSIDAAAQGGDPSARKILDINKKHIDNVAKLCAEEAEKVANDFKHVTDIVMELIHAGTATQSHLDDRFAKLQQEIETMKADMTCKEGERELLAEKIRQQEQIIKESREDYMDKSSKMGDLGRIFAACMGDMLSHMAKGTVDTVKTTFHAGGDLLKNIGTAVVNINKDTDAQPKYGKGKVREECLLKAMEGFCLNNFPSSEELKSKILEQKEFLKYLTDFKAVSDQGKVLLQQTNNYLASLDTIDSPGGYEKLKAQFETIKVTVSTLQKETEDDVRKEAEHMRAAAGIMEQMNNAAATAQNQLREERRRGDELADKAAKFRSEIAMLGAALKNSKADKLDLNEVLFYLAEGLRILISLQESWEKQAQFFRTVATVVSGPMKDILKDFIDIQNEAVNSGSTEYSQKTMIKTAMKACGVCFQVMKCSQIYQEISSEYVLPKIMKATGNMQLSKEEAQVKLQNTGTEFDTIQKKLEAEITKKKGDMLISTEHQISTYTQQLAIMK